MTTDSKNRKWPSTDERIGLVVPPSLKQRAVERARQERLPLQVFVRLAIEKQLQQESTIAA
jgi:predicted DNA binding CopG/RHH family protein